jgi:hypothetical protein
MKPLIVQIYRPPFNDFCTLVCEDGTTEELEAEDARAWFKARGANMDVVEKSLDYAWNFSTGYDCSRPTFVRIANPIKPKVTVDKLTPNIT